MENSIITKTIKNEDKNDYYSGPSHKINVYAFIECVKKYPEIFDVTHAGFKQQDDKNGAWEKIAQEFRTSATVCRKKFRTLRERYTRELRRSYLEPATPIKFEYFNLLSFLSPYIKFRSITFDTSDGKTVVAKREELSMDKSEIGVSNEIKILESDGYYEEDQDQAYAQDQTTTTTTNIIYETTSAVEPLPEFSSNNTRQIHINERQTMSHSDEDHEMITITAPKASKRKNSWSDLDDNSDNSDKYFAMSIACSLKRLSTINNLRAKGEIYEILHKYHSKEN